MKSKKNGHSPEEYSKDSPLQMPLGTKTSPLTDVTLICHHCHKAIDMTEIAEMIRMSERQRILDILYEMNLELLREGALTNNKNIRNVLAEKSMTLLDIKRRIKQGGEDNG